MLRTLLAWTTIGALTLSLACKKSEDEKKPAAKTPVVKRSAARPIPDDSLEPPATMAEVLSPTQTPLPRPAPILVFPTPAEAPVPLEAETAFRPAPSPTPTPAAGEVLSFEGTVMFIDAEGGYYGILTDSGRQFEPLNLMSDYQKNALRVRVNATVSAKPSAHPFGTPIEVDSIEIVR